MERRITNKVETHQVAFKDAIESGSIRMDVVLRMN